MSDDSFLRMEGVVKTFPGVVANDHVDFSVRRGEIHGLLGENGAGKSTLMKILYGLYSADEGEIYLDGRRLDLNSPQDAIEMGIGMVHQHFMLIPRLTVAENVVLGEREPAAMFREGGESWLPESLRNSGIAQRLDGSRLDPESVLSTLRRNLVVRGLAERFTLGLSTPSAEIERLAEAYGFNVDVDAHIWELGVGQQQRVEILKTLYRDVDLLILDEPTAVLTPGEAERLFDTLEQLSEEGISIIFITHKLAEIQAITDRVTVLRDGANVETVETAGVTKGELARMMVGREVLFQLDKESANIGSPVVQVSNARTVDDRGIEALSGVDLTVREGEIVGIAGVSGNGQKELAEAMVGIRDLTEGSISLRGTDLTHAPPRRFIDEGVSFVPEDRFRYGCASDLSVMHNATMKDFRDVQFGDGYVLDYDALEDYAETLVEEYDVRGVQDVRRVTAGELSGGNLQKLILARELHRNPHLLVANQPTRGVDVGAIEFLRKNILEQRRQGTGVVLISEDLDELFDLSDRILVIYEGEFVHETTPEEADRERVGLEMTGGAGPDEPGTPSANGDRAAAMDGSGPDGQGGGDR